jgi:hypothetical protein
MSDADKDFRIAELIYESAYHQLKANRLGREVAELKKEILRLEEEIEKLKIN